MKFILTMIFVAGLAGNAFAGEIERLNRLVVIKADSGKFEDRDIDLLQPMVADAQGIKANDDGSFTLIYRYPDEARKEFWSLERIGFKVSYEKLAVK